MPMVNSRTLATAASLAAAFAAPAGAAAAPAPTGGTSPSSSTGGLPGSGTFAPPTVVLDPSVVVTGGPVVVRMRPSALLGRTLDFYGSTRSASAGRTVVVQRYDTVGARWLTAATAQVGRKGSFLVRWRANLLGRVSVRAVVEDAVAARARRHRSRPRGPVSSTPAQVTVYSPAVATFYGPGFYGKRTACGQVMTTALVGVAHRSLPCGTLVDLNYNNRDITVPVVDRGPYANGADWDLTSAAAQALGMAATETIGTIVLGSAPVVGVIPASASPPGGPPTGGASAGG
jgi:peptidoglycan lytic transglycosylase